MVQSSVTPAHFGGVISLHYANEGTEGQCSAEFKSVWGALMLGYKLQATQADYRESCSMAQHPFWGLSFVQKQLPKHSTTTTKGHHST